MIAKEVNEPTHSQQIDLVNNGNKITHEDTLRKNLFINDTLDDLNQH